jgi:threonine synthase
VREKETSTRCPACRSPLDVRYDYAYIRSRLNRYSLKTSPAKALKYLDFYPLVNLDLVVSMNEGGTPLYRCTRLAERMGFRDLYIKNEGANPTGVFKDRGSLVELTKAKELGAKAVCVASTGNMAAVESLWACGRDADDDAVSLGAHRAPFLLGESASGSLPRDPCRPESS